MPFFEYECLNCDNEFEELIRCDEDLGNIICPKCSSREVEKLLSLFGIVAPSGKVVTSGVGGGVSCSGCSKTSCAGCQ
ncbi:MAG: zinc ribbon domain-containing protein [candidate division Zixibacteria bacterium]|nr:zinc ribbon domain-containing protein [Candidatus Tariuqbacter arcticus]